MNRLHSLRTAFALSCKIGGSRKMTTSHTPTALKRWSCQDKQLPPVNHVKNIHIYDFDNTLFKSPLPNKAVWNTSTFGSLQAEEFLYQGGWWHNPNILAATGEGLEKEEARAWEGSWNEQIAELVRLSAEEPTTLNVLLTGRKESAFGELIGKMIASKGLEFDMVCLKPAVGPTGEYFNSTMHFKQALLRDIVFTYTDADELRIYEDRVKHTKGFRDFFFDLNKHLMDAGENSPRKPFTAEVIQVAEQESFMDPVTEVSEVQKMININNQAIIDGTAPANTTPYKIKRTVFYTGYLISQEDSERLKTLIKLPPNCPEHEVKYLANNILIVPRPAPRSILDKVGGIGAKVTWKVTGVANLEQRVWAARVACITPGVKTYTENTTPCVVLGTRRQAKPIEASRIQQWQPVTEDQAFEFETTVGEKVLLRVEEEYMNEDEYESSFPTAKNARKHPREEDFTLRQNGNKGPRPQQRGYHNGTNNSGYQNKRGDFGSQRGGNATRGGQGRGGQQFQRRRGNDHGGRGGGGRGRGRGSYRSLDDNVGQGYGSGGMQY
ncbi:hypothetical protein HII31_07195 [Pseudocercospora fuligena]|uniref:Swiss Army Knife RNA repair protein HAD domain-containing protein n=1 Tax=Pseudocercospora fuligena TaxID=685502 RepID=A0A8H6RIV0_9PEZI|nr:hypothetical protein HII31_07195 [Pseudocercospora fuligena]